LLHTGRGFRGTRGMKGSEVPGVYLTYTQVFARQERCEAGSLQNLGKHDVAVGACEA